MGAHLIERTAVVSPGEGEEGLRRQEGQTTLQETQVHMFVAQEQFRERDEESGAGQEGVLQGVLFAKGGFENGV